jgi:hypothetical protein
MHISIFIYPTYMYIQISSYMYIYMHTAAISGRNLIANSTKKIWNLLIMMLYVYVYMFIYFFCMYIYVYVSFCRY